MNVMKKIFKSVLLLAAVTMGTGAFVGCSDDEKLETADALFRPIINEDDNIEQGLDENKIPYVVVTWDNYTNANQYTIKMEATDGSDTQEQITDKLTCRFENLKYDKEYFVYISSANTDNGLSSKPYSITITTLDYPTNLLTPATTDLIDTQARIKWAAGTNYDSLAVIKDSNDSLVVGVAVKDEDNAAAEKIVRNLEPKTTYRAEAYLNGAYQGKKRFTTTASEKYEGTVVDLRGLDEKESLKWINANNLDSLIQLYPNQDITIVLQGGMNYRLETVKFPVTSTTTGMIKFVTGLSLGGNAIWNVTGNFDFNNGLEMGGIYFEKIEFTDDETKDKTQGNYGGTYLFNPQSDAKVGTIELRSCTVRYKRGVLRVRATNEIGNFIADDCIFEYIGGYGITNVDNNGAAIRNIKVTNSTFANCVRMFVNTKSKDSSCQKCEIANCTFVYMAGTSRGLIELQENEIPGGISIKNCIYGSAGEVHTAPQPEGGDPLAGIKGWTGKVVPNVDGCFFTSDLIWRMKEDGSLENPFDGTTLATDTKGTFKNPNPEGELMPGDYTLVNPDAVKAKVGDPRWLP